VFFISDGFVVDIKRRTAQDVMQRLANEAAHAGVVIYTLDTRRISSARALMHQETNIRTRTQNGGRTLAESKMPQEPLETMATRPAALFLNSIA